jgi:hypothetical protein
MNIAATSGARSGPLAAADGLVRRLFVRLGLQQPAQREVDGDRVALFSVCGRVETSSHATC